MQIYVKLYIPTITLSQKKEFIIDIEDGASVDQLFNLISEKYVDAPIDQKAITFMINEVRASREQKLKDEDRVLFIHILAGG